MKTWTEISLFTCQFSTYPSEMTVLGDAVEKGALSCTAGGWAKLYNPIGEGFGNIWQNNRGIYPLT